MSDNDNQQAENKKKIFIGNLPFSVSQEQLEEIFVEYGEIVEANLITDRMTGRSKGFAFIEYADEESAQKAIDAMHGQTLEERELVVNIARPKRPRNFGGGGRGFRGGDRHGGGNYQRRDRYNDRNNGY